MTRRVQCLIFSSTQSNNRLASIATLQDRSLCPGYQLISVELSMPGTAWHFVGWLQTHSVRPLCTTEADRKKISSHFEQEISN
ncbi:unnamed protein product [Protopolystoma xenopodis]|uniref:Uncharacterized protein n=1 Tax=Protopolystoma xenopodis TaxID=117903 RepID=A0A448WPQ8_9PLAT|nr:unnamed protein product [Protopolystoma xenopodis]